MRVVMDLKWVVRKVKYVKYGCMTEIGKWGIDGWEMGCKKDGNR